MNNFLKSLMAIALAAFVFTGCVDDPCDSIECGVNGNPIESADGSSCSCDCINGFEGTACDMLATGKFIGNWDAVDMCSSELPYSAIINTDTDDQTKVKVFNFSNFGDDRSWEFDIVGDTIKIPLSAFEFSFDTLYTGSFEGFGLMGADETIINWEYSLMYDGGAEESCTGVWTKQ